MKLYKIIGSAALGAAVMLGSEGANASFGDTLKQTAGGIMCKKGKACRAGNALLIKTSKNAFSVCLLFCSGDSDFMDAGSVSGAIKKWDFDKETMVYTTGTTVDNESPKDHLIRQIKKEGKKLCGIQPLMSKLGPLGAKACGALGN